MSKFKTYSQLVKFNTYKQRFDFLTLTGEIGKSTFGYDRPINQLLYNSVKWRELRNYIIIRDNGNDLGLDGYPIHDKIIIHHINPLSLDDIRSMNDLVLDPEYLICTSMLTHNAIHYGNFDLIKKEEIVERYKHDTILWK